jgi:hypothetical protein
MHRNNADGSTDHNATSNAAKYFPLESCSPLDGSLHPNLPTKKRAAVHTKTGSVIGLIKTIYSNLPLMLYHHGWLAS